MVIFRKDNINAAVVTFMITTALLLIVNYVPEKSLLLGERLFRGGGLVQIGIISIYSGLLSYKMQDMKVAFTNSRYYFGGAYI